MYNYECHQIDKDLLLIIFFNMRELLDIGKDYLKIDEQIVIFYLLSRM